MNNHDRVQIFLKYDFLQERKLMKQIKVSEIGTCISESLNTCKKNILFVSTALEYENLVKWFSEHPEYRLRRDQPQELRSITDYSIVNEEQYCVIDDKTLAILNNENVVLFSLGFSDKGLCGFEEFLNIIKDRYYINRFPGGGTEKHSLERMRLFIAFSTPPNKNDWAALDEKYYDLFDEVYLLD